MQHKKFDREILKQIKSLCVHDNWHAPIAYAKSNIEISRNRFSHFIEHFFLLEYTEKITTLFIIYFLLLHFGT